MNKNEDITDFEIVGAGGSKGGRSPREAPNTLQSRSTIKVVEATSEGPVKGLIGGLKGVYLDETPVQNDDGSFNFPGIHFDERFGLWDGYNPATPAQDYLSGFSDGLEVSTSVNVELTTGGVTRNMDSSSDAVRIILRLPNGLYDSDNKHSDLNGFRVTFKVETRLISGGVFTVVKQKTITGKTMSAYEEAHRIERPNVGGTGAWQVRISRVDPKPSDIKKMDDIWWQTFTEIVDLKVSYDGAAVVGIYFDSESTGGKVPRRSYLMEGRLVKIPHNYTPRTYNADGTIATNASYSGIFNGTMVNAMVACDNPAWVLYDIMTNDRYGLGDEIDPSSIDIYSFYDAAVYNDGLVDNGKGGTEPRFRFNSVLQTREDAFKAVQAIAASMRAFVLSGAGYIKLIQERPTDTSAIVTNANVIDGRFNYSNDAMSQKHTAASVTFNDSLDNYNPRTIIEEATVPLITRYGYNKLEMSLLGCTHEGQARRFAKWAIDGSTRDTTMVDFKVSWNNAFMDVGDVVSISDKFISNIENGGIIKGGTTTTVTLDRPVTITSGQVLRYIRWDGSEASRAISNSPGTYTTLNLTGSEDVSSLVGTAWAIYGAVVPRLVKVIAISEETMGIYTITAITYDPTSYARVDSGIVVDPPVFGEIGGGTIAAPANLVMAPETIVDSNGAVRYNLRMDWDDVNDPNLRDYKIKWRRDNMQWQTTPAIPQSEFILEDTPLGVYEVFVYAYSTRGVQSPGTAGYHVLTTEFGPSTYISAPTGLKLTTGGYSFEGLAFTVQWNVPTVSANNSNISLKGYNIEITDASNNVKKIIDQIGNTLEITREEVVAWFGSAVRNIKIHVRARDTQMNLSAATSATFTNPAPTAVTGLTANPFFEQYTITHNASTGLDVQGYIVHHSTSNPIVPSVNNRVSDNVGLKHIIPANPTTTYYFAVAPYDSWSKENLNYVTGVASSASAGGEIIPVMPTGLTVSSSIVEVSPGQHQSKVVVQWNKSANTNQYDMEVNIPSVSSTEIFTVSQPDAGTTVTQTFMSFTGMLHQIRVRARAGINVSSWTGYYNHTTSNDTTPPSVPTSLVALPGMKNVMLSWNNPPESDLSAIQIWRRRTTAPAQSEVLYEIVAVAAGTTLAGWTDSNVENGATYGYRLAAVDRAGNVSGKTSWVNAVPLGLDVNITDFASGITPVQIVNSLPTTGNFEGRIVYLTTDDKLYRYTGSAWTSAVPTTDLTGQIIGTQITDNAITTPKIAANTIQAGHIQSNAITSDKILANSIIAGKIAAGAVNAREIAAGAITASKLAVTSTDNMVPNPNFALDPEDSSKIEMWDKIGTGTSTVIPTTGTSAGSGIRISKGSVNTAVGIQMPSYGNGYDIANKTIKVVGGDTYRFNMNLTRRANYTTTVQMQIELIYNGSTYVHNLMTIAATAAVGTTTSHGVTFTIPESMGISDCRLQITYTGVTGTANGIVDVTNIRMVRAYGGQLIVDGGIVADHIAANTINATHVGTNTIVSTSANIANATITNAKITGAIQSNDYVANTSGWKIDKNSGGGFELNGSGASARMNIKNDRIMMYDASGNLRIRISLNNS